MSLWESAAERALHAAPAPGLGRGPVTVTAAPWDSSAEGKCGEGTGREEAGGWLCVWRAGAGDPAGGPRAAGPLGRACPLHSGAALGGLGLCLQRVTARGPGRVVLSTAETGVDPLSLRLRGRISAHPKTLARRVSVRGRGGTCVII